MATNHVCVCVCDILYINFCHCLIMLSHLFGSNLFLFFRLTNVTYTTNCFCSLSSSSSNLVYIIHFIFMCSYSTIDIESLLRVRTNKQQKKMQMMNNTFEEFNEEELQSLRIQWDKIVHYRHECFGLKLFLRFFYLILSLCLLLLAICLVD